MVEERRHDEKLGLWMFCFDGGFALVCQTKSTSPLTKAGRVTLKPGHRN